VEKNGLRGSASTRIDEKGRLKVPAGFRSGLEEAHGREVFVTSLTGENVRVYPLPVWLAIEQKLSSVPGNHPSRLKFLDRVNYYGQVSELDGQGRVVVPAILRESASMVGAVRVVGRIDHLDVWNEERLAHKLAGDPWTDEDGLLLSEHGI
jgi:MraZ protein